MLLSLPDRLRQLAELVAILEIAGVPANEMHASARGESHGVTVFQMGYLRRAAAALGATGIEWSTDGASFAATLVGIGDAGVRCLTSRFDVPADVMAQLQPSLPAAAVVVPL